MAITVGTGWFVFYGLFALAGLIGGGIWLSISITDRRSPFPGIMVIIFGVVCLYLSIFAGTHFRVQFNERVLLLDTINQRIVGVRESGIQSKPLVGVAVKRFPAHKQYKFFCDLGPGTETAVTSPPLRAPVYVDSTFWLDLSEMDLVFIYRSFNGGWEQFQEQYLVPTCQDMNRTLTADFSPYQLEQERTVWEQQYQSLMEELFASEGEGFGVRMVPKRVVMAWDFANPEDATAYDEANRAANLQIKREHELEALLIEAQMTEVRASMIVSTTLGTVGSLQAVSDFLAEQPVEMRSHLMQYLGTQVNLEYLRLVAQQEPENIFPPGGTMPVTTYDVNAVVPPTVVPTPTAPSETE